MASRSIFAALVLERLAYNYGVESYLRRREILGAAERWKPDHPLIQSRQVGDEH